MQRERRTKARFVLFGGIIVTAWLLLAFLVAPATIRLAYTGEGFGFVSQLFEGRAARPVESILDRWQQVAWWITWALLLPLPIVLTWRGMQDRARRVAPMLGGLTPGRFNALVGFGGITVVLYLLILQPVLYVHFISENWWAEYGTFAGWMVVTLLLGWVLITDGSTRRIGLIAFALGAFFMAFEEIKWGQDVLGLRTPELLQQHNAQGQITLHNMIGMPTHSATGVALLLLAVGLPIIARRVASVRNLCERWGIPLVPTYLWPLFIVAAAVLLVPPAAIYLKFDEVGELALSMAAVSLAIHISLRSAAGSHGPDREPYIVALGGTLALLALVSVGLAASVPSSVSWRLNDFASNRFPSVGMQRQADELFEWLDRHPDLQRSDTYIRQGIFLEREGRTGEASLAFRKALLVQDSLIGHKPDDSEAYRNRFTALRRTGRGAEARDAIEQAIQLDLARLERSPDSANRTRTHWSLARSYATAGLHDEALEHIVQACEMNERAGTARGIRQWLRSTWPDTPGPAACMR